MPQDLSTKTIQDFGQQWTIYRDNDGFYGSTALLADVLGPLLSLDALKGARVAEVGSGTGRIVKMLLESGVGHVTAVEPSDAFAVLCENLKFSEKVTCLHTTGDQLPHDGNFDIVFSIGVLHHIPDPAPVVDAVFSALRPGGRFLVWLYGKEGNEFYLRVSTLLRLLTTRLPHFLLVPIVYGLDLALLLYLQLCRLGPLPLKDYMGIIRNLTPDKRRLVIYDQLKPAFAKYYTREEAEMLLTRKFTEVQSFHRRRYSWTVIGTKSAQPNTAPPTTDKLNSPSVSYRPQSH